MLKLLLIGALLFTLTGSQKTGIQADESDHAEKANLEDTDQFQDEGKLPDDIELSDAIDKKSERSNIQSRSNRKRDIHDDYYFEEYDSKPRKRPNKSTSEGGRVKTSSPIKYRGVDQEPQRGPLITREDICYRLKLNVLRDFERYIDLYIEKCKTNSI